MPEAVIKTVTGGPDLDILREMFREYGSDVSRSYCLNGFDDEVARLPGAYGPPHGGLLLLTAEGGQPAGMVGVRPLGDGIAEMKRLFVRPAWQKRGYGRLLTLAAIGHARESGFARLRLDTLGHMKAARALYADLGFVDIPPYHDDAAPGMSFMELAL